MNPRALGMRGWLQVAYAAQIDLPDGLVNRYEVKQQVDDRLARPVAELIHEHLVRSGKVKPNPKLWGRSPQAQRGHRAMMAMAGGPAAPRPPKPREDAPTP